ncbi:MAG: glycosyltransferase family 9 protein, partial [Candidatus Krumholzibacteriota bacterium]|nr:glycosyltransferase family 9 protein [Candidatus Krumholzibacteriota bacterium]
MQSQRAKLLVIRFSSLGDLVLLTPLLRALREGYASHDIHLATKKQYAGLFDHNPDLDKIHTLENDRFRQLLKLRGRLRREDYDLIIDAHHVLRSNFLLRTLPAARKIQLKKTQLKKMLLIRHKINRYRSPVSQTDIYLELASRLGVDIPLSLPRLFLPPPVSVRAEEIINRGAPPKDRLIALAPGARWETKRWPEDKFKALAEALSGFEWGVILIGGKEDIPLNARINRNHAADLDTTGTLSILETAAVLEKCDLLITNDSAPLHLAEAVGTPVIALFGPTVRELGY